MDRELDLKTFLAESAGESTGIFRYQPGDSLLHRLNPVTKLIVSAGLILVVFMLPDFRGPLALTLVLFGLVVAAGLVRTITPVVAAIGTPLLVSLLVIQGLFYPGNETAFWSIGGIPVLGVLTFWEEGLRFSLLVFFRLTVLMLALLATVLTTHPRELTVSLIQKGMPRKLAYVFMAALQFIPQMRTRADAIMDAQQARGLDIHANVYRRLRAFVALMTPLLIGTLIATETRALALESRGFSNTAEATSLFDVSETLLDRALQAATVLGVLAVGAWAVVG